MTFADQLKAERERLGITQAQAAALIEVSARVYWEWEHAKTTPYKVTQEGAIVRFNKTQLPRCSGSPALPCSVSSLLEWLDDNACELIAETYPIADTGDYDGAWVVYQHEGYPGGTPKRTAMGWGQTPYAAIEDARRGPEDPEKMDYVPPEFRSQNVQVDLPPNGQPDFKKDVTGG